MIYYKKRSLIKKTINFISQKTQGKKPRVFSFSKSFLAFVCLFLVLLYSSYLFLMPKMIDESNAKTLINNYILKNSKLMLDTKEFSIKPDYKFNINLMLSHHSYRHTQKKEKCFFSLLMRNFRIYSFSNFLYILNIRQYKL